MTDLLRDYCECGDFRGRARFLSDLLLADLLRHELTPPEAGSNRPSTSARLRAAVRLVADLPATAGAMRELRRMDRVRAFHSCTEFLSRELASQPAVLRTILTNTPLPATTEPDEYLFIRSVQIMELLSDVAASHADEANSQGETDWAVELPSLLAHLAGIAEALRRSTRLFRIVTTIDPKQFAHIRDATYGTGALQSSAFATLERLCRGEDALREATVSAVSVTAVPVPVVPLERTLALLRKQLDQASADRLLRAMQGVDKEWLRWKHIHCGVAQRIIGEVPGTGGTLGVPYLRQYLDIPLLTHQ